MKIIFSGLYISAAILVMISFSACKQAGEVKPLQSTTDVYVHFNYSFAGKTLPFDSTPFVTKAGDTFAIQDFLHYISNASLVKSNGDSVNSGIYQLSYAAFPQTNTIHFQVPKDQYDAFSFVLGVDVNRNHTGDQSADLSPSKGMFWSWATGYIFIRLKAKLSDGRNLGFDIGGDENLVSYKLSLNGRNTNTDKLNLEIGVDINEMFESPYIYSLQTDPTSIHEPTNNGLNMLKANMYNMVKLLN